MKLRLRLPSSYWSQQNRLSGGEGARVELNVGLQRGARKRAWALKNILVDTGSDKSGVPEEALPAIQKALGPLRISERPVFTGAGLSTIKVIKDVNLCVELKGGGGCCKMTSLLVIPELQASLLLGRDILQACKTSIDFAGKKLCFIKGNGKRCVKLQGVR